MKKRRTKLWMLRKEKKLRLREIGEKLGITPQSVHQQESTGIKTIRQAKLYAEVLGCEPVELLDI